MKSFGAIVVLYRPGAEFLSHLVKVRSQCRDVVAVDNSPAPDVRLHERLRTQGIEVIAHRNDGGLAGAYNRGARALLARGCEVIFLLDQDSSIEETFFGEMMRACAGLGTDAYLIGPKIYEIRLGKYMPVFPPGRRLPRPRRIDDEREGLFPTLFVISSGSAISAAAYRELGAFREDYFIEYIDIEYGLRAASRGVPVYVNAAVTLRQTTGRIERHGPLFTTNHVAWRRYYGARNAVHCLRLYRRRWRLDWLSGPLAVHQALCVLLFERRKLEKITAIACGTVDGLRGQLGTFERRHPRISAFCRRAGEEEPHERKLSSLEHMIDGNICFLVRLDGGFSEERLHSALARVQRKHPALRAVIRERRDGLYYVEDGTPEIPLRVVPRTCDEDARREVRRELAAPFPHDRPQLRVAWLRSQRENELLLTSSHRICDGMSMLTLVREVLRALHSDEELVPYAPVTTRDIIGDYRPERRWRRRLAARALNLLLMLLPASRRAPENEEHALEWSADRALTGALKRRCKREQVSLHAVLLVALDRAMLEVLGRNKTPAWLDSPMDARRGRLAALAGDMLFFGGGSLKIRTGQGLDEDLWARARTVTRELRRQIDRESVAIPSRYHFFERMRPLSSGQIQSLVRLGDALKLNGSWNRFALSNLGNVVIDDGDAPFRVTDLRVYVHSFSVRVLGVVAYGFDGELRFYFMGDVKCMNRGQAVALRQELMAVLEQSVLPAASELNRLRQGARLAGPRRRYAR